MDHPFQGCESGVKSTKTSSCRSYLAREMPKVAMLAWNEDEAVSKLLQSNPCRAELTFSKLSPCTAVPLGKFIFVAKLA
jgi:hypothetical protein